jgi:hypothetical protein
MSVVLIAILLQSASISATLALPQGMATPPNARAVLLPLQYSKIFNAQAQERIDNYWEAFKNAGMAQRQKEQFPQYMAIALVSALDNTIADMRRDAKINVSNFIKTASQGQVEFRGVSPGEYKLVITANVRGTDYVWMESLQVESLPIVLLMKNRVP